MMSETFTGPLVWITMCGNIDVRHPGGHLVRCYGVNPELGTKADRLGKKALCTVVTDPRWQDVLGSRLTAITEAPTSAEVEG